MNKLEKLWEDFLTPISTELLYGKYKKPEALFELEELVRKNAIDLEVLGFYLDQSMPYASQPIDIIPFATTGTDGTYFAFLTDFGIYTSLDEAPIIMYCSADFSYSDPSASYTLFAKNLKDFLTICSQILTPYLVYESDPKHTDFTHQVQEFIEDDFLDIHEIQNVVKLIRNKFNLTEILNLNAYYTQWYSQREATTCIKTLDGLNINFNPIEEKPDKIFHTLLNKEQLIEYLSTVNILSRLKFYRDYGQVYRDLDKEEFFYVLEIIIKFLKDDNFLREAHVLEFDLKKKRAYYLYHKLKH